MRIAETLRAMRVVRRWSAKTLRVTTVITGDQARLTNPDLVSKQVEAKSVPVFLVSYPPTLHTSFLPLARHGQVYSVTENSENIQPLIHLQVSWE